MANNFQQSVDKLRASIQSTRDEIETLDSSPVPPAELKARITQWVQSSVEQNDAAQTALSNIAQPLARDHGHASRELFQVNSSVTIGVNLPDVRPVEMQFGPLLAWLFGDELTKRLHAKVDQLKYDAGPPMEERPQRRAALVKSLRTLEIEEEALICRAEESSVRIARRGDADPAVVLNFDPSGTMVDTGPSGIPFPPDIRGSATGHASA